MRGLVITVEAGEVVDIGVIGVQVAKEEKEGHKMRDKKSRHNNNNNYTSMYICMHSCYRN